MVARVDGLRGRMDESMRHPATNAGASVELWFTEKEVRELIDFVMRFE